jgi:tetratricopeptide (TPR) repeat protein
VPNELEQHLAETTAGLDPDARRVVYARAREALQNEVRASAPFMPVQTVVTRRRELENAIMNVEREAGKSDPPRPRTPPAPPPETKPVEQPADVKMKTVAGEPVTDSANAPDTGGDGPDGEETRAEPPPAWSEESAQEYARYARQMETHPSVEVRDVSLASYELLAKALEDMSAKDQRQEIGHDPNEFDQDIAPAPPRRPLRLYAGVLALVLCAIALAVLLVGIGFDQKTDSAPAKAARRPAPAVLPVPATPESQLIKGAGFQDAAKEALTHANTLLARRDFTRAIAAFDDAIRLDPRNASALAGRAFAYWSTGDLDAAIRDYGAAIDRDPANASTRLNRAIAYNRKGEYRPAIDDLDRALAIEPSNADALNSRCWARTLLAHLEEALADCNKALSVRPGDIDTLDSRGLVFLRLGRLDRAIADYDAALKAQPKMASALYGRGLARIGRGDRAGGQEDVTAARAINPDVVAAFARYGVR